MTIFTYNNIPIQNGNILKKYNNKDVYIDFTKTIDYCPTTYTITIKKVYKQPRENTARVINNVLTY